jgi:hypothetical protein
MNDMQTLQLLMKWLAVYVGLLVVVGWAAGRQTEVLPVLSNLSASLIGGALAILKLNDKDKDSEGK